MQLQKRKLIFFSTLLCKLCIPNSAVWFLHRAHLHTGATLIVKVAFKFLSYLTLSPFPRFLLLLFCFVFFLSRIIIVLDTNMIHGFNALASILHQFRGINGCYGNHRHVDAKFLKANFLQANYCICKVTCTTERKNNDA